MVALSRQADSVSSPFNPEQQRRCLFFFRDPLPYDQMRPEVAARYSDAHAADEAKKK